MVAACRRNYPMPMCASVTCATSPNLEPTVLAGRLQLQRPRRGRPRRPARALAEIRRFWLRVPCSSTRPTRAGPCFRATPLRQAGSPVAHTWSRTYRMLRASAAVVQDPARCPALRELAPALAAQSDAGEWAIGPVEAHDFALLVHYVTLRQAHGELDEAGLTLERAFDAERGAPSGSTRTSRGSATSTSWPQALRAFRAIPVTTRGGSPRLVAPREGPPAGPMDRASTNQTRKITRQGVGATRHAHETWVMARGPCRARTRSWEATPAPCAPASTWPRWPPWKRRSPVRGPLPARVFTDRGFPTARATTGQVQRAWRALRSQRGVVKVLRPGGRQLDWRSIEVRREPTARALCAGR